MDSMNDSWPGGGAASVASPAQPHRLHKPGRGEDVPGLQLFAVVQHDSHRPTVFDLNPADAGPQPQFAAQAAKPSHEVAEDQPHAGQRAGKSLQENAAEHDAELAEIHVVLARAAVPHQRTEEHLAQQRIGDRLGQEFAGGAMEQVAVQVVVIDQLLDQLPQIVLLVRETARPPPTRTSGSRC